MYSCLFPSLSAELYSNHWGIPLQTARSDQLPTPTFCHPLFEGIAQAIWKTFENWGTDVHISPSFPFFSSLAFKWPKLIRGYFPHKQRSIRFLYHWDLFFFFLWCEPTLISVTAPYGPVPLHSVSIYSYVPTDTLVWLSLFSQAEFRRAGHIWNHYHSKMIRCLGEYQPLPSLPPICHCRPYFITVKCVSGPVYVGALNTNHSNKHCILFFRPWEVLELQKSYFYITLSCSRLKWL